MRLETRDWRLETGHEKSFSSLSLWSLVSCLRSIFLIGLLLSGCAFAPIFTSKPEQPFLRPGPQPLAQSLVAGDRIIYRAPELVVVLEALDQEGIGRYYESRGLPNPLSQLSQAYPQLFAFRLQLENRGPEQVAFDPSQVSLIDQGDRGFPLLSSDELFAALSSRGSAPSRPSAGGEAATEAPWGGERIQVLQALQIPLFVGFVILQPGERREGLLLFPKLDRRSKVLLLGLPALYVGAEAQPLIFSFLAAEKR